MAERMTEERWSHVRDRLVHHKEVRNIANEIASELSRARSSEAALREELRNSEVRCETYRQLRDDLSLTLLNELKRRTAAEADRDSARAELAALVELLDESLHYTDCPEEWVERGEDWIVRANKALASVRATARREGGM